MRPEDVKRLYDENYAASYESKFLTSPITAEDTAFEAHLLGDLLKPGIEWLDVACGTGYFLRQFPHVRRIGLDLSPHMLERARRDNPGAIFFERDYRVATPEWTDRFGLVSCMWYSYSLVDTISEICEVIGNLARWTNRRGTCFVPLADPRMIARSNLPYDVVDGFAGRTIITGITWSFREDDGSKVHAHLVTPQLEFMVEQFERFFATVRIIRYPYKPDGINGRPALIATDKR